VVAGIQTATYRFRRGTGGHRHVDANYPGNANQADSTSNAVRVSMA
jgi:hypothetical protein